MATTEQLYPIFLHNLAGALVVVVGGGAVGERKIRGLLAVAARVQLISPIATPNLQALAADDQITWIARSYQSGDLAGAMLVFAATNERTINQQVADDARQARILCNVADDPAGGDFHLPALHRQEDLTIAVGTGGRSPRRAQQLRDQIATWLRDWL